MKEMQTKKQSWTHGLLEYLENCPSCKQNTHTSVFRRGDDNISWTDIWTLYKCHACNSIYLSPRPDKESLPKAYSTYYTHTNPEDNKDLSDNSLKTRLINGYLNKRFSLNRANSTLIGFWLFKCLPPLSMKLDIYGRHIPQSLCKSNKKILDIGCGNGNFLYRAQEIGMESYGLETDPMAIKNLEDAGMNVHLGALESAHFPPKKFDYITLNHVIEHVEDPEKLLINIYNILKEDGIVWLALPNPNALGLKIFKKSWKGFHPPFHLFIPSQKVLKKMLENSNFVDIQFIPQGLQSKGLWKESQRISSQENFKFSKFLSYFLFFIINLVSCFSTKYSEETIVIAKRKRAQ